MAILTFLGHQGWHFRSHKKSILIDPLLVDAFGHGGIVGSIFPCRKLHLAKMPPLDAILLTHEHEDHFNIPTLSRLSRNIPIFISAHSSSAAFAILHEMGFRTHALQPRSVTTLGDIELATFAADHIRNNELDEWDVLPFILTDTSSGGSFATSVDVAPPPEMMDHLAGRGTAGCVWCITNNVIDLSWQGENEPPNVLLIGARIQLDHAKRFARTKPLASVICGSGFCFEGQRAQLNRLCFPLDSTQLELALSALSPGETFLAAHPGLQLQFDREGIRHTSQQSPFIETLPRSDWPSRNYMRGALGTPDLRDCMPVTGKQVLEESEANLLVRELDEFASYLYGTLFFRSMLSAPQSSQRVPSSGSFGIEALNGSGVLHFEYHLESRSFAAVPRSDACSVTLQCYAADLLAYLTVQFAPSALLFGYIRIRSQGNLALSGALERALWQYAHPLRHPRRYLDLYRSLHAAALISYPKPEIPLNSDG